MPWLSALGRNREIKFQSYRGDHQTSSLGLSSGEEVVPRCPSPPHGGPCNKKWNQ